MLDGFGALLEARVVLLDLRALLVLHALDVEDQQLVAQRVPARHVVGFTDRHYRAVGNIQIVGFAERRQIGTEFLNVIEECEYLIIFALPDGIELVIVAAGTA